MRTPFPAPGAAALRAWVHVCDVRLGDLETVTERLAERAGARVAQSGPCEAIGDAVGRLQERAQAVALAIGAAAEILRPPPRREDGSTAL